MGPPPPLHPHRPPALRAPQRRVTPANATAVVGEVLLYHGSDLESLKNLLNGRDLDAGVAAELHLNGAPGFYMTVLRDDAEYFAIRRGGNIVTIEINDDAVAELTRLGARLQPLPMTPMSARFDGDEYFVPTALFHAFNTMRDQGRIRVF